MKRITRPAQVGAPRVWLGHSSEPAGPAPPGPIRPARPSRDPPQEASERGAMSSRERGDARGKRDETRENAIRRSRVRSEKSREQGPPITGPQAAYGKGTGPAA